MINIYKTLGIENLIEDSVLFEQLKHSIISSPKEIVPGYSCDYYLKTFDKGLEFTLCKGIDGSEKGIAIHFCGDETINLRLDRIAFNSLTESIFYMKSDKELESFPVRVVCSDVLAYPRTGDLIYGQIVAFADNVELVGYNENYKYFIKDNDNNNVLIAGKICEIDCYKFEFKKIKSDYWVMIVESSIGKMSVVAKKTDIENPEINQVIVVNAALSMDVALAPEYNGRSFFFKHRNRYVEAPFSSEFKFGTGFTPTLANAEKVLQKCVEEGSFTRFSRACAKSIKLITETSETVIDNKRIAKVIASFIDNKSNCRTTHILKNPNKDYIGMNAIVVSKNNEDKYIIAISTDSSGFIDKIRFFEPSVCEIGIDEELHAITMISLIMSKGVVENIRGLLSENCVYYSETGEHNLYGDTEIIRKMQEISDICQKENIQFSYNISHAEDITRIKTDLPLYLREKWCSVLYRENVLEGAVFVKTNEKGLISNICVSNDGHYLSIFDKVGNENDSILSSYNVRDLLRDSYGSDDTIRHMRGHKAYNNEALIWKEADCFISNWLNNKGYCISDIELEDDCIGYACSNKNQNFAIYVYAKSKQNYPNHTDDLIKRLKSYSLSENRQIILICLWVETLLEDDGTKTIKIGKCDDFSEEPVMWLIKNINNCESKLVFYRGPEFYEKTLRFVAAVNFLNLDVVKALSLPDACLEYGDGKCYLGHGFFSTLAYKVKEYGKMKIAYVRFDDSIYHMVFYFKNYCYLNICESEDSKVGYIFQSFFDYRYRDFIISDENIDGQLLCCYPLLKKVDFVESEKTRFSIKMLFDNEERRQYDLLSNSYKDSEIQNDGKTEFENRDEVVEINNICFTDKIFKNGKILDHIDFPDWIGYRRYAQCGQGLSFVNGYSISTAELYFNSHAID